MAKPMLDEAALSHALSQIAQEEVSQLEWELQTDHLPFPAHTVQETFDHHRPDALRLIRRRTRSAAPFSKRFLPLAACLVLAVMGAFISIRRPVYEDVPIRPLATAAVPLQSLSLIPEGWRGNFFPTWLPEGYAFLRVQDELTAQEAVYQNAQGNRLVFSEDQVSAHFELQGDETASFTYQPLDDQTAALTVLSDDQGTFVVWDANGQTLMVTLSLKDQETALSIARSVEPVKK